MINFILTCLKYDNMKAAKIWQAKSRWDDNMGLNKMSLILLYRTLCKLRFNMSKLISI
jgi:hypothetical protein